MTLTPRTHWWLRLWHLLAPRVPDFFSMLDTQADNLRDTVSALADYFKADQSGLAERVHDLVEQGHAIRDNNLQQLYGSFITPIDREDIYTLSMSIDHILDYLKNTVREVEVLQVEADEWMHRMTAELANGAASLALGLAHFHSGHSETTVHTIQTREAERRIEDLYREALANMFQGEEYQKLSSAGDMTSIPACLDFIVNRIKRREVYRHLSNAADRLARAGEALRDISIKYDGSVSR